MDLESIPTEALAKELVIRLEAGVYPYSTSALDDLARAIWVEQQESDRRNHG